MFDLFLSLPVQTAQVQTIAQAQAAIVYLPIATRQSSRPSCVTYIATNSTSRAVTDVNVNRRNSQGEIYKYSLWTLLGDGVLKAGESVGFDMCDNSFVNVEARQ